MGKLLNQSLIMKIPFNRKGLRFVVYFLAWMIMFWGWITLPSFRETKPYPVDHSSESLLDHRPSLLQVSSKNYGVCFVLAELYSTGGIEAWFWTLYESSVFKGKPFAIHAVHVEDYCNTNAYVRFVRDGVHVNPGHRFIAETCDIIIQSGTVPIGDYALFKKTPRILVLHGSKGCKWTWKYAKFAARYDKVVAVSLAAKETMDVFPEIYNETRVIPSSIDLATIQPRISKVDLLNKWNIPVNPESKILLFLGRISGEKNPEFFNQVVDALPYNWIGIMVGPSYYNYTFTASRRVYMVGRHDHPGDALALADASLMASPKEGGPIVLLEAWAAKVPFFMRRTGLAASYPNGVFIIDEDESEKSVANRIVQVTNNRESKIVQDVLAYGHEVVLKNYLTDVIAGQWDKVLSEAVALKQTCSKYHFPLQFYHRSEYPSEFSLERIGSSVIISILPTLTKEYIFLDLTTTLSSCIDQGYSPKKIILEYLTIYCDSNSPQYKEEPILGYVFLRINGQDHKLHPLPSGNHHHLASVTIPYSQLNPSSDSIVLAISVYAGNQLQVSSIQMI